MNFFDIGNVGKEPELKTLDSGKKVAKFSLATVAYKGAETEWFDVVAWDGLADIVMNHFKQGDRVLVQGNVKLRKWDGGAAMEVTMREFKFAGGKKNEAAKTPPKADDSDGMPF